RRSNSPRQLSVRPVWYWSLGSKRRSLVPSYRLSPMVGAYQVGRRSGTARALTSCSVSIARLLRLLGSFAGSAPVCFLAIQPTQWADTFLSGRRDRTIFTSATLVSYSGFLPGFRYSA